jgi:hypothetical protein
MFCWFLLKARFEFCFEKKNHNDKMILERVRVEDSAKVMSIGV